MTRPIRLYRVCVEGKMPNIRLLNEQGDFPTDLQEVDRELHLLTKKELALIARVHKMRGSVRAAVFQYMGMVAAAARPEEFLQKDLEMSLTVDSLMFLARFGRTYCARPNPRKVDLMEAGNCHGNSAAKALCDGFGYAEGFACMAFEWPRHHSWNLSKKGLVKEFTWPRADLTQYFGVSLTAQHLRDIQQITGAEMAGGVFHHEVWSPKVREYLVKQLGPPPA